MKRKTKKITLLFVAGLLAILAYWVFEPYSLNPVKEQPYAFSKSEINFSCNPEVNYSSTFQSKADSLVDNAILLNDFIGVSAGVCTVDCGTWTGNAGFSHKQEQRTSNKNTLHRIASISKPMTAIAIMQLYERGEIDLDVPIQDYVAEYPKSNKGEITIRQLLKHTSGVQHYSSMWDGISFTSYPNMIEALNEFKERDISFVPGTEYQYTSYGYTILGAIIEKVSGMSYQDYMIKNIWEVADMRNTNIENSGTEYDNKADLYIKLGRYYIKSPKTDLSVKAPGGGVYSTAEDLLKFGKAIWENKLIDSSSLNLMISSTDSLKQGTPYGFGWFVIDHSEYGRILQHGGSQSGTSSFFQIFLDQKIATAALANNFGSDDGVYYLVRDLSNLLVDSTTFSNPITFFKKQENATLQKHVGNYQFEDRVLEVTKKGKQLFMQEKPYPKVPVYSQSEDRYFCRLFDGQLDFSQREQHSNEGVVYTYNGKSKRYVKVN